MCVLFKNQKKKKKNIQHSMNIRIRIFSIGLFNDRSIRKKKKKQKKDWGKKLLYISASLYLFSSAALTLLSHCWLLLSFYSRPRSPSVKRPWSPWPPW